MTKYEAMQEAYRHWDTQGSSPLLRAVYDYMEEQGKLKTKDGRNDLFAKWIENKFDLVRKEFQEFEAFGFETRDYIATIRISDDSEGYGRSISFKIEPPMMKQWETEEEKNEPVE